MFCWPNTWSRYSLMASIVLLVGMPLPGTADDVPVRKPGQWELKTISGATGTIVSRVCITPADNIILPSNRGECKITKVLRAAEQTIVNVVCRDHDGEERISSLLTGDFTSWYRSIVKMTFDPPGSGPPNLGVTIEGKYLGQDC